MYSFCPKSGPPRIEIVLPIADLYPLIVEGTNRLISTFLATLFLELEFAIYLGVVLSLVLFLAKTSTPRIPALSIDKQK
jgi:SulP family sulfate permease